MAKQSDPTSSPSVLVTGGTGFLGSYLIRYLLKKGYRVSSTHRPQSTFELVESVKDQVEWMEGDILDVPFLEDAMEQVDQVYHCAAMVSFDPRDVKKMMQINVEGTANVVNTALYRNIQKLLHVSSVAAIGRVKRQVPISEKTKWQRSKYNTNYAISKFLSEQEAWRGDAEGLNVVVINPATILGSGFWERSTVRLFKQVQEGLRFYPVGTNTYVDVRDVARLSIQLMEANISGQRVIAASEHWSYLHFFTAIAQALGKKPPSIRVNYFLRNLAWQLEWFRSRLSGQRPLITRETALQSARNNIYENYKSIELFQFDYIPVAQTIQEVADQLLTAQKEG
ncbi:MAG: SDR family NAD(P)-dependent oxidoreductase, partial [Bacteroidota bacterium]